MGQFNNPLEKIRIASPCAADWNEMQGDQRKRFCGECKLNVYNLSAMTKREAENLLINSEGRLCVRFYRRADGTILTRNCPVGWAKVKQRVSRITTATFSLAVAFFGGLWSFNLLENLNAESFKKAFVEAVDNKFKNIEETSSEESLIPVAGEPEFFAEEGKVIFDDTLFTPGQNKTGLSRMAKKIKNSGWANGRPENLRVVRVRAGNAEIR